MAITCCLPRLRQVACTCEHVPGGAGKLLFRGDAGDVDNLSGEHGHAKNAEIGPAPRQKPRDSRASSSVETKSLACALTPTREVSSLSFAGKWPSAPGHSTSSWSWKRMNPDFARVRPIFFLPAAARMAECCARYSPGRAQVRSFYPWSSLPPWGSRHRLPGDGCLPRPQSGNSHRCNWE